MEKTSKESNTTENFRVLMFPFLAHGHISPYIKLAKRLAQENFKIYFCSTEINLSYIKKDRNMERYFSGHSIVLVQLDLPSFPELPPYYHTTKNVPPHLRRTLSLAFYMGKANFQDILYSLKPELLIYDMYQAWVPKLASASYIPSVLFLACGAVGCSWNYHHANFGSGFSCISGRYPFPEVFLRDYETKKIAGSNQEFAEILPEEAQLSPKAFELSSDIILVKSWRGIESKYFDHLSSCCGNKIVALGALTERKHDDFKEEEDDNHSHLIEFLNGREESSVVYVSFGSETFLSKEEMEEMAHGLELSNANFMWVVRFATGHAIAPEDTLPEGFLERVKEKGVVVDGWAPQTKILEHSSIGGFVSHCGWGSLMESIYFGVPLLALPMNHDQPLNARVAVAIGVGIEILRDEDGKIMKEEVAKVINEVVVQRKEVGESLKQKAKELSHKLREEGEKELHEAVEKLRSLCSKNKIKNSESKGYHVIYICYMMKFYILM